MVKQTFTKIYAFGFSVYFGLSSSILASDSRIKRPPYRAIEQEMLSLANTQAKWVDHINYGRTAEGRDLHLLRISKKSWTPVDGSKRKAVYIDGAIHGNEYLHIEDRLPRYFVENQETLPHVKEFLEKGGLIYAVPIFNPDGFSAGKRRNANDKDLNRDFPLQVKDHEGLEELETQQFLSYFENELQSQNAKLSVSMNYHCCVGSLLTPWSVDGVPMPPSDLAAHRAIGTIVQEILGQDYRVGSTREILHQSHAGTAKDYFYERHLARAFTFEGKRGIEDKNFFKHVRVWERIFEVLNSEGESF